MTGNDLDYQKANRLIRNLSFSFNNLAKFRRFSQGLTDAELPLLGIMKRHIIDCGEHGKFKAGLDVAGMTVSVKERNWPQERFKLKFSATTL
jgi:hypothetical protein